MSCTEIHVFDKEGNECGYLEVGNAFRSAMAVWLYLEDKYLLMHRPSYVPDYLLYEEIEEFCGYRPSRTLVTNIENIDPIREIWNLADDERLTEAEKITLKTTFDNVIVRRENFQKVIDAFNEFGAENTSLKEQATILTNLLTEDYAIAVGWNQTSVGEFWGITGEYDDQENPISYNILTGTKHWELFSR